MPPFWPKLTGNLVLLPSRRRRGLQALELGAKQGRPIYGMDFSVSDAAGREVAHDGVAFGSLLVRGSWVAASYYRQAPTRDPARAGWFDTGDVVTMDADGYVQIVDRTKDVIKIGRRMDQLDRAGKHRRRCHRSRRWSAFC